MMIRIVTLLACLLAVGACAMQQLEKGLNQMVGQDVQILVAKWGTPLTQSQTQGDTIYTGATPIPQAATSAGFGSSSAYVPVTYQCTIEVVVDASNRIKSWVILGDRGACDSYANRL